MNILFEPRSIGRLTLKNRFIKSSTAESMAGPNGEVTSEMVGFYESLAKGGLACIFLGHVFIDLLGKAHPRMTGIHDDKLIPGFHSLAKSIHRQDCFVFAQLNHGGSRVQSGYVEPVGPSAVINPSTGLLARELSSAEIWEIIESFGRAAARVRKAGLDGVLIHGGHGYLVSLFSSPLTNHRTDEWGGSAQARFRFVHEVYRAIRRAVGYDFPVAIKLGIKDDAEGGLSIEEGAEIAKRLAAIGTDAIEISGGILTQNSAATCRNIVSREQEAYFLPYAKAVRSKVSKLPLILVGGLRSPDLMEEIIKMAWADFVSLARPFICEPDLVAKIQSGRWEPVSCTRCEHCRIGFAKEGLHCQRDEQPSAY
jgi:2,4-dienoyl-CoA reductase-like NADH-dependent reductase (Old Yellow Enzyme family)